MSRSRRFWLHRLRYLLDHNACCLWSSGFRSYRIQSEYTFFFEILVLDSRSQTINQSDGMCLSCSLVREGGGFSDFRLMFFWTIPSPHHQPNKTMSQQKNSLLVQNIFQRSNANPCQADPGRVNVGARSNCSLFSSTRDWSSTRCLLSLALSNIARRALSSSMCHTRFHLRRSLTTKWPLSKTLIWTMCLQCHLIVHWISHRQAFQSSVMFCTMTIVPITANYCNHCRWLPKSSGQHHQLTTKKGVLFHAYFTGKLGISRVNLVFHGYFTLLHAIGFLMFFLRGSTK